ncbi:hypothetical protein GCM10008957_51720 [Deinococcus ruber]|uniref:Uncharacterized protein n=1 Tax=Deinococcus ruber TaxID=1848197 RepID=A0A918FFW9_9DEIO|nr:hypothetical protein GCM10008957_51720 [Deinococcus ruber]
MIQAVKQGVDLLQDLSLPFRCGGLGKRREILNSQMLHQREVVSSREDAKRIQLRHMDAERLKEAGIDLEEAWRLVIGLGDIQLIAVREVVVDVMPDIQNAALICRRELENIDLFARSALQWLNPNKLAVVTEDLPHMRQEFNFIEKIVSHDQLQNLNRRWAFAVWLNTWTSAIRRLMQNFVTGEGVSRAESGGKHGLWLLVQH